VTDIQELRAQIQHANGRGQSPAYHVLALILDFLPDPTVFVDADVPARHATDPGQVFVVTKSRVVLATFEDAETADRNDPNNRSSVEVATWRRSDLRRISLEGSLLEGNSEPGWENAQGGAWPTGVVVTLSYKDIKPIRLPMANSPTGFHLAAVRSITQELLADLA